jgi:hypothetical protein
LWLAARNSWGLGFLAGFTMGFHGEFLGISEWLMLLWNIH